ncbi:MAG TPA: hypothetical protein VEJ39_11000 [Candidatus Acidoferrales bacterium]|nr:hypothetical protein [Candidatus Acidoferrales bacterium]
MQALEARPKNPRLLRMPVAQALNTLKELVGEYFHRAIECPQLIEKAGSLAESHLMEKPADGDGPSHGRAAEVTGIDRFDCRNLGKMPGFVMHDLYAMD